MELTPGEYSIRTCTDSPGRTTLGLVFAFAKRLRSGIDKNVRPLSSTPNRLRGNSKQAAQITRADHREKDASTPTASRRFFKKKATQAVIEIRAASGGQLEKSRAADDPWPKCPFLLQRQVPCLYGRSIRRRMLRPLKGLLTAEGHRAQSRREIGGNMPQRTEGTKS
jgi:hypothetical protein